MTKFIPQLQLILLAQRKLHQNDYQNINDNNATVLDQIKAVGLVKNYAKLCTIDNLEQIIATSLNNSNNAPGADPVPIERVVESLMGLPVGTITVSDLKTLDAALSASDPKQRTGFVAASKASHGNFANAKTINFWDAAGQVKDMGPSVKILIEGFLNSLPPTSQF